MEKYKWKTEQRKVNNLLPFDGNPRQMTERQVELLKKSIEKHDLAEIPAINTDNQIIAGHQRIKILQMIGRGEEIIDVRVPTRKLTQREVTDYCLTSNKVSGEWDYDMLANLEEELLLDVGFESEELDKIFDLEVEDAEDDLVPQLPRETNVKKKEIYQLGDHRLMCGDATKKEDVKKLMNGNKADMVFTDPPYNIGFDYENYKDDKTAEEYKKFCEEWFKIIKDNSKGTIAITSGIWNIGMWYLIECPTWVIAWLKMNGMSRTMLGGMNKWEPVLLWNLHKDRGIDVIDAVTDRIQGLNEEHPAPKPVKLITTLLKRFSKREQIVLDLFGGSGSTLIACEKLNRKCYMMELDPKYVDVIIKRYEQYTNKKVKKVNK